MKAAKAFGATATSSRLTLAAGRTALGAFIGTAAALAIFASAAKAADTRTLDLYNMHTKERLTITFKKDGRYVPSALAELNRFLRDWRRNEATRMDPRLFDTVWELYQKSGSRQPIHVVCGYRSLATNNLLRSRSSAVAKHSQHTLGKAMDLNIPDVSVDKLRMIAVQMQNGGIGWYPSANSPFVHVDVGSVRAWPRLTRTQLVGLFPDGKTAHIPSDGKPLPGYQQALAELQREKGDSSVVMASADSSSRSSGKGLLAMLFSNDEEDSREEISSASGDDDAPAAAAPKLAPVVMPKPTMPAATPAAPAAPVLTAAFTPPAAMPPATPERRVTSLADATLPAGLEPATVPQLSGADRLAMDNVPLPQAKPSEITGDLTELAMADAPMMLPPVKPPVPVEVPLPVAANRQDDAIAAQLALAEVAQDQTQQPATALSFAPPSGEASLPAAAPARQPTQVAALLPAARKPAPPAAPAAELARPLIDGGKSDMFGNIELPEVASEDGSLLLDGSQSVYWGRFRTLTHPDQLHLATMFEAPAKVVNTTFSAQPYGALVSTRFAGQVAAPTQIIDFTRRQLAMR